MPVDVWEWLSLIDHDGPFLSKAALKSFYPSGLPRPSEDEAGDVFNEEFGRWSAAWFAPAEIYAAARDRWVTTVLRRLLDWSDDLQLAPAGLAAQSPNGAVTVTPWAELIGDSGPSALVTVVDRTNDLRSASADGWSANAIDRMAVLLRETGVTIGIVTDGRWWALVSAAKDVTTASGVWDALLWREERPSRDAFFALASYTSIAGGDEKKRLPLLFSKSVASAEEITEALGDQVRRAVELVLQSMSDTHLRALAEGEPSPLPEDPKLVYEGAVTVLMRIVFLLFAEERGLLPEHDLYRSSYAIAHIREQLQQDATAISVEALDHSWEAWHRLLAASNAVFGGASFQDMRMPAYGGSLFDPDRFPWLHATDAQGRLRVRLSDRAMLAVLRAVQTIEDGAMQLSFRDLDVEQIGYVYEGLLGYSAAYVSAVTVGLHGKAGFEPEIPLPELEEIAAAASSPADFSKRLVEHLKKTQEQSKPRTANQIARAYAADDPVAAADARTRLRYALLGDDDLAARLEPFHGLIRNDLRGFPYVVPAAGLVMTESPQRANTGTHYTPRALAEEVVLHALEPLVYSPGPLDTENRNEWKLKSSAEILDLKIADIAAGSGAFLVAAARYLADRLIEARANEGLDVSGESDLKRWAVREIVARCLYGADINGMAVEMCKLSLWLISMDPSKPFSFVDDRVFHGNSLLGVTTEEQLKAQHILPDARAHRARLGWLDIDGPLDRARGIRGEIAAGQADEADPMRSIHTKRALLIRATEATSKLRVVADGVVAAALSGGGKRGRTLERAFDRLADLLRAAYPESDEAPDVAPLNREITAGLTPTANTGDRAWRPLHWVLEAPEVFVKGSGFDAVIGNPPFLAGKKISTVNGSNVESLLKLDLNGMKGAADLSAHFIRRAWRLLRPGGVLGLIATDRIGQGDTAAMSTQVLVDEGVIFRALATFRWPGQASTGVAIVWAVKRKTDIRVPVPILDGVKVAAITSSLTDSSSVDISSARRLPMPFLAGTGVQVYGEGFLLDDAIRLDPRLNQTERGALRAYVNGHDLMSGVPSGRVAVDAGSYPTELALLADMPTLGHHLKRTVQPIRDAITSQIHETRYWAFWDKRERLFQAVEPLERFIVVARDTRAPVFLFVDDHRALYSYKVVVIASDQATVVGALSSSPHLAWFERLRTGRGTTSSYIVSRILWTFPLPDLADANLRAASDAFLSARGEALVAFGAPTKLYNSMDDRSFSSPAVETLRAAQIELDRAVLQSYGWGDLQLTHGFFEVGGVDRFTCAPDQLDEMRRRLLAENGRRAASPGESPSIARSSAHHSEPPEGAMF